MSDIGGDIYRSEYVKTLFDEMSDTYGVVNVVSSFGFCVRWRRQCVGGALIPPHSTVCDLFSGTGELWPALVRRMHHTGRISAVDFSPAMSDQARRISKRLCVPVDILVEDVLTNSVPDGVADVVVSSFGLKTFRDEQLRKLAFEIARILKPGGKLSLLEISVPKSNLLRIPYMFYINRVIPMIGRLFLGNPENYRLLGVYTESFGDCARFLEHCKAAGLKVRLSSFFFGCATGVLGEKPAEEQNDGAGSKDARGSSAENRLTARSKRT